MATIIPSILSADFSCLGEQARQVEAAGAQWIQIDVMDGCFVPNITFGAGLVKALRAVVGLSFDVHLMIVEPERHLKAFVNAGADRLIVHQEACPQLHRALQTIHQLGIQAGVAINPGTSLHAIEEVLDLADVIQIMTVNPGAGGQEFIHSQLDKIARLREMLIDRGLKAQIAVDGGIDIKTAPLVVTAGASLLVVGSSIYNHKGTVERNLAVLRASIEKREKKP